MLRRLFAKTAHLVLVLLLLTLALGGTYYAVKIIWRGTRVIGQSQARIAEAVNPKLQQEGFDPVESVNFTNASRFWLLPETLEFQAPLFGPTAAGRRPVGQMTGRLDPLKGTLVFDIDRFNGTDESGIKFDVKPVE